MDRAFIIWSDLGIKSFKDLYIDNIFASFQQLSEKFALPKQHVLRYLQICSFISSRFPQFPILAAESTLDTFLKPIPALKGMMSYAYAQIHSLRLDSLNSIKGRLTWEKKSPKNFGGCPL